MDSNLLVWKVKLSLLAGAAVMAGVTTGHDEASTQQAAFATKVSRSSIQSSKRAPHVAKGKRAFSAATAADL